MSNKADRGTKRTCQECEARFYDLNKDPITCPMCGVIFKVAGDEPEPKEPVKETADSAPVEAAAAEKAPFDDAQDDGSETPDAVEDELSEIETDDVEISTDDDDNTFLEEEDDDTDVTGIIGTPVAKGDEES